MRGRKREPQFDAGACFAESPANTMKTDKRILPFLARVEGTPATSQSKPHTRVQKVKDQQRGRFLHLKGSSQLGQTALSPPAQPKCPPAAPSPCLRHLRHSQPKPCLLSAIPRQSPGVIVSFVREVSSGRAGAAQHQPASPPPCPFHRSTLQHFANTLPNLRLQTSCFPLSWACRANWTPRRMTPPSLQPSFHLHTYGSDSIEPARSRMSTVSTLSAKQQAMSSAVRPPSVSVGTSAQGT